MGVELGAVSVEGDFDQFAERLRTGGDDDGDGDGGDGETRRDGKQGVEATGGGEEQRPQGNGGGSVEGGAGGGEVGPVGVREQRPETGPADNGVQAVFVSGASFGGAQDVARAGG